MTDGVVTEDRPRASPELETFLDALLAQAKAHHHFPAVFVRMRAQQGSRVAVTKLVQAGEAASGFAKLAGLGLVDWTFEAAVLRFPGQFTPALAQCARFRIEREQETGTARGG